MVISSIRGLFQPILEGMKPIYLLFTVIFFAAAPLFSETVFLYTVSEGTEDTLKSSVPYLEDGIFETLFDAGHIVFNDSSTRPVAERGLETYKEPEDILTAKAGGASFLMEIYLHYRVEDDKEIPTYADYRLFNVVSGKLLADGTTRVVSSGEDESEEEKLEATGIKMVKNILSFL